MRTLTRIITTGLVAVLFLTGLPICIAQDKDDWSKVQAVAPDTETEVHLTGDRIFLDQETIGLFHSATDTSITLNFESGGMSAFQKTDVYKIRTYRPVLERWPGWAALAVSSIVMAIVLRGDTEAAPWALLLPVGVPTVLGFYGAAPMKEVYKREEQEDSR